MSLIVPSVFATNTKDYVKRFNLTSKLSKRIHLDIMDGKFVPGKTPNTIFLLNNKNQVEMHLMVSDPRKYIKEIKRLKVKKVFIHLEIKDLLENILFLKENNLVVGIAINPETKIKQVVPYSGFAESFIVMAVKPGKEGQKFILKTVSRVKELRKIVGNKEILVDGGINLKTVALLKGTGARAVSGSFVSKSNNPAMQLKLLEKSIK